MTTETKALGERAEAMLEALASISAEPDRLTRLYLTEEHRRESRESWGMIDVFASVAVLVAIVAAYIYFSG